MSWHLGELSVFDLETTGIDVRECRVVTGCVGIIPAAGDPGTARTPEIHSWLADPGVEIPEGASAVHGITTEHARENGGDAAEVVDDIVATLAALLNRGVPIVGANLQYDLTLLLHECLRHDVPWLTEQVKPDGLVSPIVDVMVIDRAIDPYRKGGRKLTDLSAYYGVRLDGAHDAAADALAAGRIAWKLGNLGPRKPDGSPLTDSIDGRGRVADVSRMSLAELHAAQVRWKAAQAKSLAAYFAGKGQDVSTIRGEWPFIPSAHEGAFF